MKEIQKVLAKSGVKPTVKPSGTFDENTDKAVRAYQKKNRLKVDGIVGKNTSASMFGGAKGDAPELSVKDPHKTFEATRKKLDTEEGRLAKLNVEYSEKIGDPKNKVTVVVTKLIERMLDFTGKYLVKLNSLKAAQAKFEKLVKAGKNSDAEKFKAAVEKLIKDLRALETARVKSAAAVKKAQVKQKAIAEAVELSNDAQRYAA